VYCFGSDTTWIDSYVVATNGEGEVQRVNYRLGLIDGVVRAGVVHDRWDLYEAHVLYTRAEIKLDSLRSLEPVPTWEDEHLKRSHVARWAEFDMEQNEKHHRMPAKSVFAVKPYIDY